MVLSHLLEFAAFSILYYGQLTTINGHYPEVNQSEHIYGNRYNKKVMHAAKRFKNGSFA